MQKVNFYDRVDDSLLKFAVIVSKHNQNWVFCRHKGRSTYECPGGRREDGESIDDTARRELWEETGAVNYEINPVSIYGVETNGIEDFGMLYFAEINEFEKLPALEIEKIELSPHLPDALTYPLIQPTLMKKINEFLNPTAL